MTVESVPVLFEDQNLLFASKPTGLLTEGGGKRERDLEQVLSQQIGRSVFCCHRLDRLTSGVVLLRKTGAIKAELARLFEGRKVRKEYWALVQGRWDTRLQRIETKIRRQEGGKWECHPSEGKSAVSTAQPLGYSESEDVSLVRLLLKTGRTHQARLHCAHSGYPILGDTLYGGSFQENLFGLHAYSLSLLHPSTGQSLRVNAPHPPEWNDCLSQMKLSSEIKG